MAIFDEKIEIRERVVLARPFFPHFSPVDSKTVQRRALPAFGAPSGAFRFLSPPRPALDLFLCAGLCKIFVRSGLLAKLFTIYVVCSPLASPLGRLGSIPWVLRFGHCTTPESHGVYLDPTQFHRTSNITETDISKDLRLTETRQTAIQICSAYSFFIFARDFFLKPLSLKF